MPRCLSFLRMLAACSAAAASLAASAHHKAEIDKWWPVIRQAGIKSE